MRFQLFLLASLALLAGCAWHRTVAPKSEAPTTYKNPYTTPLSTPGARFGSLPPIVQNTVRSEAGTGEIIDARKESRDGHVYYKIVFRDSSSYPPLYVGPDGSVLNPDLTVAVPAPQQLNPQVSINDLPVGVRRVIQQRPEASEVASIVQETWGDHTIYVVSFKDEAHHPKMYIVAEGTTLINAPK